MNVRIISCEDDPLMLELLERQLKPYCSKFTKVETLREAVAAIEQDGYNICLLDLRLRDTGQEEALAAIRFIKSHKCAVVVITGIPDPTLEQKAKEAGADYFVRKGGPNFGAVLKTACEVAILHLPGDAFKSNSFLEHINLLKRTVLA